MARSLVCGIYDKRFLLYYVETKGNQALSGLNLSIVGLKYQIQIELFLKKNERSTFQPVELGEQLKLAWFRKRQAADVA